MFYINGFRIFKKGFIVATDGKTTLLFRSYDELLKVLLPKISLER